MLKDKFPELYDNALKALTDIVTSVITEVMNPDSQDVSKEVLTALQLHTSHAVGELIEAKSNICELTEYEKLLKETYEQEMDTIMSTYSKIVDYKDILEDNE